jgi:2,3-bisphosphoglycerate-dependent phosphoglycerate mutase
VLVTAHGNSLRGLVKHLDKHQRRRHRRAEHPDRHPARLPPRRELRADRPGEYLDPEAAAAGAAAVANQGKK